MKYLFIFILFLVLVLESCLSNNKNPHDDFYIRSSGWDYRRLPLIKPYQAISTDRETWIINISEHSKLNQFSFSNVKKIAVIKDYFFVYCSDSTLFNGIRVKEAWFLVNPYKKTETGFLNKNDFDMYLKKNQIPKIEWYEIDETWKNFDDKIYLPWKIDTLKIK